MDTLPWYRQFWPWFIMALPATVVVAGLSTWYIAEKGADDLVATDYYKNGMEINVELHRQELARKLGIVAELRIEGTRVDVTFDGPASPAALQLALSHPLDADRDIKMTLARLSPGVYRGILPTALSHRWHYQISPVGTGEDQDWRVDGEVTILTP